MAVTQDLWQPLDFVPFGLDPVACRPGWQEEIVRDLSNSPEVWVEHEFYKGWVDQSHRALWDCQGPQDLKPQNAQGAAAT